VPDGPIVMRLARRNWRPPPLVLAIVTTIGAAALVLYLQQRAMTALESQNAVIVRQLAEQTAADIALELRRTLNGPIFDTLAAVNHPELRAGRLDLVGQHFARGPDLGRAVLGLARQHAGAQQIYLAAEGVGSEPREVFLRLFWTDARRLDFFAVLGFVIEPASMRERLFAGARGRAFDDLLLRRGGDVPLQLRITDDAGEVVYGTLPATVEGARLAFPMLFYPADDIRTRLAAGVAPRPWLIDVGAPPYAAAFGSVAGQRYWPTALSLLLMLAALGLTVQAHRRPAELARMQTDFVTHVSHQLKTPLSLLSTATETLQMDRIRSPEKLSEYLDTIRAEAARLTMLVQRVLEFSRVQQPRSYEFEQVDLGALVRETVDAFAHALNRPGQFDVTLSRPGPYVRADPAALEQVVANLLDNAVKYSGPDQPVTVNVRVERLSAVVDITDCGVGIAPADQARIFERFYRVPGAGSTFRVTLRCLTGPMTSDRPPLQQPEAAS